MFKHQQFIPISIQVNVTHLCHHSTVNNNIHKIQTITFEFMGSIKKPFKDFKARLIFIGILNSTWLIHSLYSIDFAKLAHSIWSYNHYQRIDNQFYIDHLLSTMLVYCSDASRKTLSPSAYQRLIHWYELWHYSIRWNHKGIKTPGWS
jgi:hypothetical protein